MKMLIAILLISSTTAFAEIKASNVVLAADRTKQTEDTMTFAVTETATVTIEFSTGEVYLVGCNEETAAIVFWKKLKVYFAELVSAQLAEHGIRPTHIQFGKGSKKVSINVRTGQVRWHRHKNISGNSRLFWDQVVLVGRQINEIETITK